MAIPKKILHGSGVNHSIYVTFTKKTVVQEISIFNNNNSNTSISIEIFRVPILPTGVVTPGDKVLQTPSIAKGSTERLSNLRWVFNIGDQLMLTSTTQNQNYNVFVDGVELD